jgi:hypothetical protein
MSNQTQPNNSVGFVGLLTILFIALKLTGHIGWSWWWVLSPLWISAAVGLFIIAMALMFFIIAKMIERK